MTRQFLVSFLLTLAAELPFFLVLSAERRSALPIYFLNNLLTNPAAVLGYLLLRLRFPACPAILLQLPLEAAVIAVEGLVYRSFRDRFPRPGLLSVSANLFSWILGLLINSL